MDASAATSAPSMTSAPSSSGSTSTTTPQTSGSAATQPQAAHSGGNTGAQASESAGQVPQRVKFDDGEYTVDELKAERARWKAAQALKTKADHQFQEWQRQKQQDEALKARLKTDANARRQYLEQMGLNPLEFAESILLPEVQAAQMSPEQRAMAEIQSKLEALEAEKAERAESERVAQQRQYVQQLQHSMRQTFANAWKGLGLPESSMGHVIPRIAALADQAMDEEGNSAIPPEQIVAMVHDDLVQEQRAICKDLSGEQLIERFGDDIAQRISKAYVARIQAKRGIALPGAQPAAQPAQPQERRTNGKYMSPEELRKLNANLLENF